MKTYLFSSLVLVLVLCSGCKSNKSENAKNNSIHFKSAKSIDIGQYLEQVHFVQLENHPESAFTDIDKIIVSGEKMFMLDKRLEAVFCFDTTGKFKFRIQRIGKGPGEYQELDAIWVKPEKKELWLQSFWPSKIMVYNFEGQLLRDFPIRWSARDMIRIGDDLIAGYNSSRSNDGTDSLAEGVFLLNERGTCKGQSRIVGDSTAYWSLIYQRNLEEYGKGALLLTQSDTIFGIDEFGKSSPDVILDWGPLNYPEEFRKLTFDSPRLKEASAGHYVHGKDQLVAFGPVRLFRIFFEDHMELALADISKGEGAFSSQIISNNAKVPLLYPLGKSDHGELIGIYDMDLLIAMKESRQNRQEDSKTIELYQVMDSLVNSALEQDRPVIWFAKIKQEWLTTSH